MLGAWPPLLSDLPPLSTGKGSAGLEWYDKDAQNSSLPHVEDTLVPALEAPPRLQASLPLGGTTYVPGELDALACLFTAVKVLFSCGAVARAQAALALAEPAARASAVALHETPIRNEAAFFLCISALLKHHPVAAPPTPPPPPLFLLGDSHVLSGAWRTVALRHTRCVLVPLLVTGLKAFHLRPKSSFYTKKQWQAVTQRLPVGARVVTLFGEIDCREGLLAAVEKGVYDTVPAAAAGVAAMYVDAVARLTAAPRCCDVFVHPVPAVLDVTRALVTLFNDALRKAVLSANNPRLRWLEFGTALLGQDGKLLPEYALDGAHLSPRYVDVLGAALAAM